MEKQRTHGNAKAVATEARGEFDMEYKKAYDNPYRVLATQLVGNYPPRCIYRILNETAFVKSLVLAETRQLDMGGFFLDCIDQELTSTGNLRKKNQQMKMLGEFYFSQLDIARLREEIRKFADEMQIEIE